MIKRMFASASAMVLLAAGLHAHVIVQPRESAAGAEQVYTVRVPNEMQVPSTALELDIPAGLHVIGVASGDGYTFDVRRENDRVVAIIWTREIKPRERAEFTFTAHNPASGQLQWKAHQTFADATVIHWIGDAGTKQPASITKLTTAVSATPATEPATEIHKH